MISEQFFKDTPGQLSKLFEFLGVENSFVPPNVDRALNVSSAKRLRVFNPTALLKKMSLYEAVARSVPEFIKEGYRRVISKELDQEAIGGINEKNLEKLRELYKEDISLLSQLLGHDFKEWPTASDGGL